MYFGDVSRLGRPFSKDPAVVRFGGRYLLYYSLPPYESGHPFIFYDPTDGGYHLFFQGNADNGRTWYLARREIFWRDSLPALSYKEKQRR